MYFVYNIFVFLFIHVFILFTYFLQFFDHPVIIDLLTDRWCGGYKNRKLSRLWWFLLTVWCHFDIVLFPLIFLLTCVMGKVIYLHEFVDISFSLRASSPGRYGGWAGKGRRACNYVSGIWTICIEKVNAKCLLAEMNKPWYVFFNVCLHSRSFPLRAEWRKLDSSVGRGATGEIVAISPFFSRPAARASCGQSNI